MWSPDCWNATSFEWHIVNFCYKYRKLIIFYQGSYETLSILRIHFQSKCYLWTLNENTCILLFDSCFLINSKKNVFFNYLFQQKQFLFDITQLRIGKSFFLQKIESQRCKVCLTRPNKSSIRNITEWYFDNENTSESIRTHLFLFRNCNSVNRLCDVSETATAFWVIQISPLLIVVKPSIKFIVYIANSNINPSI